jgi:hypothetical protein
MVFLLNNKPVDALALVLHRSNEQEVGRAWVKKLRTSLPLAALILLRHTNFTPSFPPSPIRRQSHPPTALRGAHPGRDREEGHRTRDAFRDASGRHCGSLRRTLRAQDEAPEEPGGVEEADEAGGQRRAPAGGVL